MGLVSALDLASRRFEDCSQGERQRLLLARALMAGVDEFVMKPFTPEILVEKMKLR